MGPRFWNRRRRGQAKNFYGPAPEIRRLMVKRCFTKITDRRVYGQLMDESDYKNRRKTIEAFNATSKWVKRGIGFQPVKFGISFTTSMLNHGALLLVYADGSVQLNQRNRDGARPAYRC